MRSRSRVGKSGYGRGTGPRTESNGSNSVPTGETPDAPPPPHYNPVTWTEERAEYAPTNHETNQK
jgi:hypothetical protein